jgi:FXSXX-COOH protein
MDTFEPSRVHPGLVDVTDVPLAALLSIPEDSALGQSLRRVTAPVAESPQESVSRFGSAI